jgi:hypothetical protein
MGSVAQVVSPGAVLVVACLLVAGTSLAVAALLRRSSRRQRAALDEALVRSRDEVELLSRKLEQLSDEVGLARQRADQDREYVITSLGTGEPTETVLARAHAPSRPPTGIIEDQLVEALARQPRSLVRSRAVELVVRTVALGHGVRRALSADVLDRAAAEAHVARRRSRRDRRRLLRQARRMPADQVPVPGSGREVA